MILLGTNFPDDLQKISKNMQKYAVNVESLFYICKIWTGAAEFGLRVSPRANAAPPALRLPLPGAATVTAASDSRTRTRTRARGITWAWAAARAALRVRP